VPRFEPFRGIRYDASDGRLDAVIAPPYDVISPAQQAALEASSPYNAVRLELPRDEPDRDRYHAAATRFLQWRQEGALVQDEAPAFYLYQMGFHDEHGRPRHTAGVIGALGLAAPGDGDVLPHERTMPKPKGDRLELLRACRANLSPVWGLSMAQGLSALCEPPGPPLSRATDEEGVHHRLWRFDAPARLEAVAATVASAPVVIADGHHRYETALAYQAERRAAAGGEPGGHDLLMAFVVELSEEQLSVRPTHRLLSGLPAGVDLVEALARHFVVAVTEPPDGAVPDRMAEAGGPALVTPKGTWLLRALPATVEAAGTELDSGHVDVALATLERELGSAVAVGYEHGWAEATAAVAAGEADAAVLLRPATVAQIAAMARVGERMPPKTTYFWPKPRTGLVFREVAG
jgi:uncharacterized protein (DUF1015 family)